MSSMGTPSWRTMATRTPAEGLFGSPSIVFPAMAPHFAIFAMNLSRYSAVGRSNVFWLTYLSWTMP